MSGLPIVVGDLYAEVVGRERGGCQCRYGEAGACGTREHKVTGERCVGRAEEHAPLLVVAKDPKTPFHIAAAAAPGDLLALCRGCYTRRATAQRKARADELLASCELFDVAEVSAP